MAEYDIKSVENCTPYELLAAAIVQQAVADYHAKRSEIDVYRRGTPNWERARCELYIIESWFFSEWCDALTYGQGAEIVRQIKRGVL